MTPTFNPLPFVFVSFGHVDESPAHLAYNSAAYFRRFMEAKARDISPEASRRLGEQWARLLDAVLLEETARMCATLRAGFAGYAVLN